MGKVYCAFDRLTGEPVAVKVLHGVDALDVERFELEASILSDLDHPAIVRYITHGVTTAGEHWLAMEWLDGEDLAHRLTRGRLGAAESIALARRAADALGSTHARGMVHRDVKPSNLVLCGGDAAAVKLCDFGIARVTSDLRRLTCTGVLMGTLGYVAPEQIQGHGDADARADVFALGCVLYECLTGRPAFAGAHPMAVLAKILLQGSPSLGALRPDLPEALVALVGRMLAGNPAERPRDAAEVAGALAGLPPIEIEDDAPPVRSSTHSRPSFPPASLGLSERRLVSVVFAGNESDAADATLPSGVPDLAETVAAHGGRLDLHAGRSLVVTFWSNGDAADRADRAARCALALHARAPAMPICVATGRGLVAGCLVGGDLIDLGVSTLRGTPPGVVRIDEATAGALGPRFSVERSGAGLALAGVRPALASEPPLLARRAPFVGRARQIAILEAMIDGCEAESTACATLVIGPSGAGKSRLLRELEARLERRDPRPTVHVGRPGSLSAGAPFGMIADMIRRAAGVREGAPLEERQRRIEERVGQRLAGANARRVAAFLGELSGSPFSDESHEALRAARRDPMLMGDSMRAAWEDFLAAECAAGPVILALDDLHRGDAATVGLVDSALRNLRERPLMVLALGRPELLDRFPGIWAKRAVQVMRLGPLPRAASEAWVRDALGASAPGEVVSEILERAAGNPFYLQELVRAAAAGRGDALPASVLSAVEARLDAEDGEARRVLRAASVFGRRFCLDGIVALTGGDPDQASGWLARLEASELIAPASARGGEADYVFRHALVREAAYATLTDDDREIGHALAGNWLERAGPGDALAMAEHFQRGAEPLRSVPWYRRAAEQALEANDLAAAIARAEDGIACAGGAGPEVGRLRMLQAEAHVWRGELALAAERGGEAAALLEAGGEAWFRAVAKVVLAAGKLGDLDLVESWIEPVTTAAPPPDAAGARIVCLGFGAGQLLFGGRLDAADRIIDAIDRTQGALDAQARASVHQVKSFRASMEGDLGGCLEGLTAALAAFEEAGDRRNAGATYSNLGHVYAELGSDERAEEALRAALEIADHMGLADLVTVARHNLGLVLARRGQLAEARAMEEAAIEGFARQGERRLLGVAQAYLARISLEAGDLAAAEREARASLLTFAATPPLRPLAGALLSRALLRQGRTAEARAEAEEAYAALAREGHIEEGEALVRLAYAEALLAEGESGKLGRVLAAARGRIAARATRIRDHAWRRRFLADVPDNARTLALALR
jgi:eukaryotic-like serine/threonine-protein kinase